MVKTQKTNPSQRPQSIFLVLVILLMGVFLAGNVSAMDIDNSLRYEDKDMKVTLENVLGLPILGSDLGVIELKSHPSVNYVLPVGLGKQVVMYYDFDFKEVYKNGLGDVEFIDMKTGKVINKEWQFVYQMNTVVTNDICLKEGIIETDKNGTEIFGCVAYGKEDSVIQTWLPYDTRTIPKGKIRIGIEVDGEQGDLIDGVWKVGGQKITKHAVWTADLNVGLKVSYKLDETTGTVVLDDLFLNNATNYNSTTLNVAGKIGTSYNFSKYDWLNSTISIDGLDQVGMSISVWVKQIPKATQNHIATIGGNGWGDFAIGISTAGTVFIQTPLGNSSSYSDTGKAVLSDTWVHLVYTHSENNDKIYINGTLVFNRNTPTDWIGIPNKWLALGNAWNIGDNFKEIYYLNGQMDEFLLWNRTLNSTEITQLYNNFNGISYGIGTPDLSPNITINSPASTNYTTSPQSLTFNFTAWDDTNLSNVTLWVNGVLNQTNSSGLNNSIYLFPLSLGDGDYTIYGTATDNKSQSTNSSSVRIFIDSLKPQFTINSGSGTQNYSKVGNNQTINITITDTNLHTCWYNYNSTNTTFSCTTGVLKSINLTLYQANNSVTFYANDSLGNTNSTLVNWNYKVFENSRSYNAIGYETATETYDITITSNPLYVITNPIINYGGVNHSSTQISSNYYVSESFGIPVLLPGETNKTFYWIINYQNLINGSDSGAIITDEFTQNVTAISLGYCSANSSINFTAANEENLTSINTWHFLATFEYWVGSGILRKNVSISNYSINSASICLSPSNFIYHFDAIIQYEKDGFVKRNYYLVNATLNNQTQNVTLYLLESGSSTAFIVSVKDGSQLPITDAYIYAQRYYPGTGSFQTVAMGKTDDNGNTVLNFEVETEDYRIIVVKDGEVIYQSESKKIFCSASPCTLPIQTEGAGVTGWTKIGNLSSLSYIGPVYDTITGEISYTYIDSSGTTSYGRLKVYTIDNALGKQTICNINSSSSAATLICDVSNVSGVVYADAYISRSPEVLVWATSFILNTVKSIMGMEGLFWSMIVISVLAIGGAIMGGIAGGIVGVIVGMIGSAWLGIAAFGAITVWGIIILGVFIIWQIKN